MIVYYDPNTKEITAVGHRKVKSFTNPYIKISAKDAAMLEESGMHVQGFYVDQERLHRKSDNVRHLVVTPSTNNRYSIPVTNSNSVDFLVKQVISRKQIEISLSESAFLDKEKSLLAVNLIACYNNDPHLPLWTLHIPSNTLSTAPLIYDYSGQDDIRFYTLKIFENYLHERIS